MTRELGSEVDSHIVESDSGASNLSKRARQAGRWAAGGQAGQLSVLISDSRRRGPISRGSSAFTRMKGEEKKEGLKLSLLEMLALVPLCTMGVSHFLHFD